MGKAVGFLDKQLKDILLQYNDGDLNLQSDFQRQYVWPRKKASRLIDSILLNVPIPPIFLAELVNHKYEVIDGQQRLTSIIKYLNNEFKLVGLPARHRANNKLFKELDDIDQRTIKYYTLRLIILEADKKRTLVYDMFERINSGSIALTPQELRNSVYRGEYNEFIKDMAKNETFKKLINIQKKEFGNRMQYEELVLLFFTVRYYSGGIDAIKNISKQSLNNHMEAKNKNWTTDNNRRADEKLFFDTFDKISAVIGYDAFRIFIMDENTGKSSFAVKPMAGFSKGLFITLTYLFSLDMYDKNRLMLHKDMLVELFKTEMTENEELKQALSTGATIGTAIRTRHKAFKDIIEKCINMSEPQPRLFTYAYKQELFNQNPTCKICGNKIDNIDDAEVDHIIAFVNGGTTDESNAQLTHRYCNRKKSKL